MKLLTSRIFLICLLSFVTESLAYAQSKEKIYKTDHFIIRTSVDSRLTHFLKLNAEEYYENLTQEFFPKGFKKKLNIYYYLTESQARKEIQALHLDQIHPDPKGTYRSDIPALYTYYTNAEGTINGWGTLFHEITHHFNEEYFSNQPVWFNEGLAAFLGEQTRIVKGQITLGRPNPHREKKLRDGLLQGKLVLDLKKLVHLSDEDFYAWEYGYEVSRAFFHWLYDTQELTDYLHTVSKNDSYISEINKITGLSFQEINQELMTFVEKKCFPAAFVGDTVGLNDKNPQKQKFLETALQSDPKLSEARIMLAVIHFNSREFVQCRKYLQDILDHPQDPFRMDAANLFGRTLFEEGQPQEALKYFQQALAEGEYHELTYENYFWIGRCYSFLGEFQKAKEAYQKFLDENWEPEEKSSWVRTAQDYIGFDFSEYE